MLKLRFDRRTHAIKVPLPLLAIVIIMGASYSIRAHDDRPETTPVPTAASATQSVQEIVVNSSHIVGPNTGGLSIPQQLDRSVKLPGIKGVVRGVVGTPLVRTLPSGVPLGVVTDFPFSVKAFDGPGPSPYPTGVPITLRVPGGATGSVRVRDNDAPTVTAGEELFVFVRNQEVIGGGNTSAVLVASSRMDVFVVRNGVVYGQGEWAQLAEPIAIFEKHFVP